MDSTCSICKAAVNSEEAAILAMGGFGNPRYMCTECAMDFDEMTLSRDEEVIASAISRIGKKISECSIDDKLTLRTVEEIMKSSVERKEKIKAGTYDFSEEDAAIEETEEDGVPEELRESEEDIERERIKAERYAKFDKITNWFCLGAFIGALGFVIYRIVSIYFL